MRPSAWPLILPVLAIACGKAAATAAPTPLACKVPDGGAPVSAGVVGFTDEDNHCYPGGWAGQKPAGAACTDSLECAAACCSCGPLGGHSATLGLCLGGVCADANTACCAYAAEYEPDPTCWAKVPSSEPPQATTACLLFGGTMTDEAWTWDGGAWTASTATPRPSPRQWPTLATLGGKVLVFGGQGLGDTWIWDGAAWTQPTLAVAPPARAYAAAATLDGKVLLFGGCQSCGGNSGLLGDTWQWDGQSWTELHPAQSPPARWGAVAGTVHGKIVLFGGEATAGRYFGDTWQWDGFTWTQQTPATSPPLRAFAGAGVAGETLLLFGGASGLPLQWLGDTWEWDGATWTQQASTPAPSARGWIPMGSLRGERLLFGGWDGTSVQGDMWTWSGSWAPLSAAGPTARASGGLACY